MAYGLIGLYSLYLIFVGFNGNASKAMTELESDAKGFAPWLLAIVILKALSSNETIAPMVRPFIGLAILTFVLRNFTQMKSQVNEITGLNIQ